MTETRFDDIDTTMLNLGGRRKKETFDQVLSFSLSRPPSVLALPGPHTQLYFFFKKRKHYKIATCPLLEGGLVMGDSATSRLLVPLCL